MRARGLLIAAALLAACPKRTPPASRPEPADAEKIVYPDALRGDVVDELHSVKVPDPYRWLEDPDSPETRGWIDAENRITFDYLRRIPERDRIRARLERLYDFEKYEIPFEEGGKVFFEKNDGLQNQHVLYVADSIDAEPRVLVDPNAMSADGTVSTSDYSVSEDGRYLAYTVSASGSDWQEWRVREVATGQDLPDVLRWAKWSSAAWTHDGKGFYYQRYPEPEGNQYAATNYYHKVYYHRLGTPQAEDVLVYERPDEKEWGFGAQVSDDGRWLVITTWKGTGEDTLIHVQDLQAKDGNIVELIGEWNGGFTFLGNDGPVLWFKTLRDAPRGRIVQIDTRRPAQESWKEIVPQANETMTAASLIGDRLIVSYLEHAKSRVKVFDASGRHVGDVPLPAIGTVSGFHADRDAGETYFSFRSFNTPAEIHRYDVKKGESRRVKQPKLAFDPDAYVTEQVFYHSKDGTRVPMFLTHRKDLVKSRDTPVLLYGYGGFSLAETPSFSASVMAWLELGGVYAVANIRGGNEYGEEWHLAGTKLRKQNVFDDFIAAAEWLIAEGWTSTPRLAILGGSNGGLLVGACLTQRPELFGVAFPMVGVMDMLRFHRFTIGYAWVDDYGSAESPDEFEALHAYSPYHNVKEGTKYPATMITTADHDDRVVPGHSFKFAAAMQHAQAGDAPVLIRIETKAGHGAATPTSKKIEEAADRMAFAVKVMGLKTPW